ncbi:hypothetical protein BH09MYX1_BH09MYX1_33750 [soil metagenome]
MNIQTVDPIEWVKRNQASFFPGGKIDVIRLLAYVMSDVLELGRGECRIVQHDAWWSIVSDADWLAHAEVSVRELFERVVPAPAHGEHSMRAEVLLSAYAEDVFTHSDEGSLQIKGQAPEPALIRSALKGGWSRRLIAFRLGT